MPAVSFLLCQAAGNRAPPGRELPKTRPVRQNAEPCAGLPPETTLLLAGSRQSPGLSDRPQAVIPATAAEPLLLPGYGTGSAAVQKAAGKAGTLGKPHPISAEARPPKGGQP